MPSRALGIDIGGTKIRALFLNADHIVWAREYRTPGTLSAFTRLLTKIIGLPPRQKQIPIGIAVPGVTKGTSTLFCPNIPYLTKFDFRTIVPPRSALFVDHDARCFARAEAHLGSNRNYSHIFALVLGTGIGRAYASGSTIKKIAAFEYPEKFEPEYQMIRAVGTAKQLADFLAKKLLPHIRRYTADALLVGGGVLSKKYLLQNLRTAFKEAGYSTPVFRARFKKNSVALGAALAAQQLVQKNK